MIASKSTLFIFSINENSFDRSHAMTVDDTSRDHRNNGRRSQINGRRNILPSWLTNEEYNLSPNVKRDKSRFYYPDDRLLHIVPPHCFIVHGQAINSLIN